MFDPTEIVTIGWLKRIERIKTTTMVDWICVIPWKLNTTQNMARGGEKQIRVILVWGDCNNVWSNRSCNFQLIEADRTRQDEHNGWLDLCLTLQIEYNTEHGVEMRQKIGLLLTWEDCYNIWSDQNCGYRLIAADITRQDEHNDCYDLCLTLTIE